MDVTESNSKSWGRAWEVSYGTVAGVLAIITCTPLLILYFYLTCVHFQGSLSAPLIGLYKGSLTLSGLWGLLPAWSWASAALFGSWVLFQIGLALLPDSLHRFLPGYQGGKTPGAVAPSGNQLMYNINGLQAWVITHLLFVLGSFVFLWFSPSIIFDHWGPLLWVTTAAGNVVALFAYIKARLFPSSAKDRTFTGSFFYDYYMGIEFNPRVGPIDFKLFFNGRPGIVAWTLINISYAAAQYQMWGYVTNSMIIVNVLQALYVIYFFWYESWYLHTIDISHDHFGWMLAWGDLAWLPYMYTLQGLYLVYNPVELSWPFACFVMALGLVGYIIFHTSNRQKDLFRRSGKEVLIWGKPADYILCSYTAADGKKRDSKLLTSGWWGVARHFNYTGDLMGCLAYGLACGFDNILPYFYFIYMAILLVHRTLRDEHRCKNKYGAAWDAYCKKVPYRLIPGVF